MRSSLFFLLSLVVMNVAFAEDACALKWKKLFPNSLEARYQSLVGKCDEELKAAMRTLISTNTITDYTQARQVMFSVDKTEDNRLCSVYSEICIPFTSGIPDPNKFNCEHTWPQSMGAKGIAKTDVHHLYAVDSRTNSKRSNNPFCDIASGGHATETVGDLGKNQDNVTCFEPKGTHKGKVARSMFYFSVRYNKPIDETQEAFFRDWNEARAVTGEDKVRNDKVEAAQHNRNPFVDHPEFAELISDF